MIRTASKVTPAVAYNVPGAVALPLMAVLVTSVLSHAATRKNSCRAATRSYAKFGGAAVVVFKKSRCEKERHLKYEASRRKGW